MKRFLGILCCVFAFSACDDGDLIVDTIDFSDVNTSNCSDNNLLFKLKESEALILNVPEETFVDDATPVDDPITLNVSSVNQVVYNFYDGKVSSEKICDLIPPASPNIKTQWNAASGVIEITTTVIKSVNEAEGSTRITGYNNTIIFKNITFAKADGTTQFYEEFPFGDYKKNITQLPLDFEQELTLCDSGQVYEFNDSESLTIDIDPALIINEETPLDSPRVGTIGLAKNILVYRLYNSVIPDAYFCQDPEPVVPTVKEEWLGRVGGVIEVTTTSAGPNTFNHKIILKNVTLEKGNSNFQLGTSYLYGDLLTIKQ